MPNINLTFTDTNGTALPTHDANWIPYTGVAASDVVIIDNSARRSAGTDGRYYYSTALGRTDFVVTWDHYLQLAQGLGGILFNASATSVPSAFYVRSAPSVSEWQIYRIINDSWTKIGFSSFSFTDDTTYACRIERDSATDSIVFKVNGTEEISVTDSALKTNDRVGLGLEDSTRVFIDNLVTQDLAAGPAITSAPATAFPGQSRTVTGTGFGATRGTGGLTIGGVTQTITSWSDTEIIFTTVLGTNNYGTGKTLEVTTDAATTVSDTIDLVADTANGFGYVDMSSPNTTDESSVAFGATPTVVTGDQFEWEDFTPLGNLTIDAQGFVTNVDTEGTFRGRFWDATDSTWGAVEAIEVAEDGDLWPYGKGINPAAPQTWTWGRRHPKTNMRVRIYK